MNAGFSSVCSTIGVSEAKLESVLKELGYNLEQIHNMNAGQIINAINQGTAKLGTIESQLNTIIDKLEKHQITQAEANAQIIKLLGDIKASLDELNANFKQLMQDLKQDLAELKQTSKNIENNGQVTNAKIDLLRKDINAIANDISKGLITLNDVKALIQNGGGSGQTVDLSKIEAILTQIGANQAESNATIIQKLDKEITKQEQIKQLLQKQSGDINDIKIFLQQTTPDNTDVINAIKTLGDKVEAELIMQVQQTWQV